MTADTAAKMPTTPPVIPAEGAVTVGMGLIGCAVCGTLIPIVIEAWVDHDDDGDPVLAIDSDIRDLELHMAVHEFAGETSDG